MSSPAGVVDGLLADRYRLVARLGTGGNGEVWHARDERLDRDVAVKVLQPELADDEDVRARLRAEARHAGRLRHPGIAAVFDFAEGDDGAWLVMELVDGQPLSDLLRQEGRLPVDRTIDVVEQAAHDGGLVHRDVKPGNLLLRGDGRLSLTDFGIAHATGAAALTRTGQLVGTASYLSPEQASGRPVRAATDLYALGVVAYECLSGRRPYERDGQVAHLRSQPPPLPPDVPEPVADLVHRLMAKEPTDRPASAMLVREEAAGLPRELATAPPTAVLPAPAARPTAAAGTASPAAPGGTRPARLGPAGRPGQRRAVRATAVALGVLAIALGVRDATKKDSTAPVDVRERRPAASAPPAPAATEGAPVVEDGPAQAPAQAPIENPAQPQNRGQGPAQPQDGGQSQQGQQPKQLEKQQEQQQDREKQKGQGKQDTGQGGGG